jgi:hypothetical protein
MLLDAGYKYRTKSLLNPLVFQGLTGYEPRPSGVFRNKYDFRRTCFETFKGL